MKIEKPKIAIFSDLHLGKHNNSADWHQVAIDWCDWFIDELRAKKIKDVIFMGDWHDNRNEISVHTLDVSAMLIDKFADFNLHMVVGNHDIPYKHSTEVNSVSVFANRPNIEVYTQLTYVEAFDRKLCFAPWESDLTTLDRCDAVFGHLEIQTFKMGTARACTSGWSATDLLKKCKDIYSGHFHLRCEKQYKEGNITYVGNPFQMDFGDRHDVKGYYVLDLDSMSHVFYENNVSPIHHIVKLSEIQKDGFHGTKVVNNNIRMEIDVDIDTKELFKLFDKVASLRPMTFTQDYTFIAQSPTGALADVAPANIDVKEAIEEYMSTIDVYGKAKAKEYILDLYDKTK